MCHCSLGPAVAMGSGAIADAMLTLPVVSVLMATLLLGKDGIIVVLLVIVAVVTSHVVRAGIAPQAAAAKTDAAEIPESLAHTPASDQPPGGDRAMPTAGPVLVAPTILTASRRCARSDRSSSSAGRGQ